MMAQALKSQLTKETPRRPRERALVEDGAHVWQHVMSGHGVVIESCDCGCGSMRAFVTVVPGERFSPTGLDVYNVLVALKTPQTAPMTFKKGRGK
jgi:hypothetical protein